MPDFYADRPESGVGQSIDCSWPYCPATVGLSRQGHGLLASLGPYDARFYCGAHRREGERWEAVALDRSGDYGREIWRIANGLLLEAWDNAGRGENIYGQMVSVDLQRWRQLSEDDRRTVEQFVERAKTIEAGYG